MAYITFSTSSYPEAERLEASQDVYAAMANIDVALPRGTAITSSAATTTTPP